MKIAVGHELKHKTAVYQSGSHELKHKAAVLKVGDRVLLYLPGSTQSCINRMLLNTHTDGKQLEQVGSCHSSEVPTTRVQMFPQCVIPDKGLKNTWC